MAVASISSFLLSIFLDPIRGKAFDFGPVNLSLLLLSVGLFVLNIISFATSNIDHSRLWAESFIFLGVLFIIGGLNTSILFGGEEVTFFGTIFFDTNEVLINLFMVPLMIFGVLLLIVGFYLNSRFATVPIKGRSASNKRMEYRPDIDGLRALAVLPVIFYHLKTKGFEGGFVGVDVFFVISGYLITSIIYRELQNNSFSLANFYERRIRRIFPALFLTLFFTVIVGYWLLDADTFKDLGSALFSTTFFTSNLLLRNQAGYFDKAAELKPLLHTWSLALEEQFYIFFPLFFLIIFRLFKKYFKAVLISLAIASFVLSQIWVSKDPSAAFYLIQYRAWELLLGSILAVGVLPKLNHKLIKNFLGIFGGGLILFAVFTFSAETSFPGAMALIPTLGALLIIYSGGSDGNVVSSLLSSKPLVFTGKISYSLYLWHWILIVLARYYNILPLNFWQNLLVFVLTFVLSTLAWKFVENPFRDRKIINPKAISVFGISILLFAGAIGFAVSWLDGLPDRFEPLPIYGGADNQELKDCMSLQNGFKLTSVENNTEYEQFEDIVCHMGPKELPVSFAIMGDSHLKALSLALDILSNEIGIHGIVLYSGGCPPSLNIIRPPYPYCKAHNDFAFEYLSRHNEIENVFFVSRWAIWADGSGYKAEFMTPQYILPADQPHLLNIANNPRVLSESLEISFTQLEENGQQIFFVNDVPEIGYLVREGFLIARRTNRDINRLIAPTFEEFNIRYQPIFDILDDLKVRHPSIKLINAYAALCDETDCFVEKDGYHLYSDDDHVSIFGAFLVAEEFREAFESIKP